MLYYYIINILLYNNITYIMEDINEWDILDLYFKNHKYSFTNHHLDSYRDFIKNNIPNTIKSLNPITMIKYNDHDKIIMKVDLFIGGENGDNIYIDRPITYENGSPKLITPNDARLKNLTYETHIYADILVRIKDDSENITNKTFKNIALGGIPIMLHSEACLLNGQGSEVLKKLGECIYDTGGYFIIDGKEKVIVSQERIATNRLFITKIKDDNTFSYKGLLKCTADTGETVLSPKNIEFYLVKNPDITIEDDVADNYKNKKGAIMCSLFSFNGKIPLFVLYRALGMNSDKEIYESIFGDDLNEVEKTFINNFIRPTILNNEYDIYTQEQAINYLKPLTIYKTNDHVRNILITEIFPNIPLFKNKAKYLSYLIKQFIYTCLKINQESDRDSYIYKRIDSSGYLLSELFYESYKKLYKFIRDGLDKIYNYDAWNSSENFINNNNIYKIITPLIISKSFSRSLKGMWGLDDDDDPELGKVQDLSRISYIGYISHLRNVNMPLDRSIKLTSPHRLHSQQYGYMCPFATPDGGSVGYLKNLALLTKITSTSNVDNIKKCLIDLDVILIENFNLNINKNIVMVFINGSLFAITKEPYKLIKTLRLYRRNNLINILISISWNIKLNEIRILTDAGRPCRPLIINSKLNVKNNYTNWFDMLTGTINTLTPIDKTDEFYYKDNYTNPYDLPIFANKSNSEILKELEKNGALIEYLDADEEDTCFIAMKKEDISVFNTHLEIHPSTMLSAISGNIPLSNHNQSARNVFHAAQSKQAIGIYATNFNKRFDTMSYVLHYSQKPIISTRISQYTCSDNMPNGFNVIVAIMSYSGFNQEDSIMINKNSIERGLFSLSYYKSITGTSKIVSQYEKIIFGNAIEYKNRGIKVNNIKNANYNYINNDGIIKEGIYIPKGQQVVAIGMISVKDTYKEIKKGVFTEYIKETIYSDCSIITDNSLFGKVDKVFINNKLNDEDSIVCKVRFLKIKKPEFGDKHASRHGQKGVIGMIIPEESMPFTKNGIKPDIIINPHAIPSRMTIGHLVECVFAKLCCLDGILGDGTVFLPFDKNIIYDSLEKKGLNSHGNEILYNGFNGNQIKCEIFIGPTYYFRLKHMVAEKMHSRGTGPKVSLTRQPTAGRRKNGGLRIGEMERDSVLSHGISSFMKESMTERSDKYSWAVCKSCGVLAVYNKNNNIYKCDLCKNDDIAVIETPYSFKLLVQELEAMNIQMRLNTDRVEFPIEQLDENYQYYEDDLTEQKGGNIDIIDMYDKFYDMFNNINEEGENEDEVGDEDEDEVDEDEVGDEDEDEVGDEDEDEVDEVDEVDEEDEDEVGDEDEEDDEVYEEDDEVYEEDDDDNTTSDSNSETDSDKDDNTIEKNKNNDLHKPEIRVIDLN